MKVVSYYNVVPVVNKSQEKFDILTKFIKGVNAQVMKEYYTKVLICKSVTLE